MRSPEDTRANASTGEKGPDPAAPPEPRRGRKWIPAILAALVVLGVWGPNLMRPPPPAWTLYVTAKNQTRRITLGDHSVLRLNGGASVRVVFEDDDRRLAVTQAEVALTVVRDPRRPFLIAAGDRQVRIESGELNLLRQFLPGGVRTVVTLRQGRARVRALTDGDDSVARPGQDLGPGDQLTWVDGQPQATTRQVNPDHAFAWENRQLIYDATPLGEVITDLNRYVPRPIRLADPALATLNFTGVLAIDSEDRMLKKIEAVLPVRARIVGIEMLISAKPPCRGRACDRAKPAGPARAATDSIVKSLLSLRDRAVPPKPKPVRPAPPAAPPAAPSGAEIAR